MGYTNLVYIIFFIGKETYVTAPLDNADYYRPTPYYFSYNNINYSISISCSYYNNKVRIEIGNMVGYTYSDIRSIYIKSFYFKTK